MSQPTMILSDIRFVVLGLPQPAGSKRAFPFKRGNGKLGVAVSDANPKSRDWKNSVRSEAASVLGEGFPLLAGPLHVEMAFTLPRPKGHFGSGRNAQQVKASAPQFPAGKPDVLKLARAVEDALSSVVWRDDAQIVSELLLKRYGEPAAVSIMVKELF